MNFPEARTCRWHSRESSLGASHRQPLGGRVQTDATLPGDLGCDSLVVYLACQNHSPRPGPGLETRKMVEFVHNSSQRKGTSAQESHLANCPSCWATAKPFLSFPTALPCVFTAAFGVFAAQGLVQAKKGRGFSPSLARRLPSRQKRV